MATSESSGDKLPDEEVTTAQFGELGIFHETSHPSENLLILCLIGNSHVGSELA